MRKLSIMCSILLVLGFMSAPAFSVEYCKDYLEDGNPGGWTASLKTFDEEITMDVGSTVFVDVWINDLPAGDTLISGGFVATWSTNLAVSVTPYVLSNGGPWDPSMTSIVTAANEVEVGLGQLGCATADAGSDIILAKLEVQKVGEGTATITFTVPPLDTFVSCKTFEVYDPSIPENIFTIIGGGDPCDGVVCDDQDACTEDSCVDGECVFDPIPGCGDPCDGVVCDDQDACTEDSCVDGECVFDPITCDDQDVCTEDSCVDGECVFDPIPGCGDPCDGVVCDDQDACTEDSCVDGECVFDPIICDDQEACTEDSCVDGECVFDPIPGCEECVTLTVGSADGAPGETGVPVEVGLVNLNDKSRGVQVDICDEGDHLTCTGCEVDPTRANSFSCSSNEREDGCCRVVLVSDGGSLINEGTGTIFTISYDVSEDAPGGCKALTLANAKVSDEFENPLPLCQLEPGEFCFALCGDISPSIDPAKCGDFVVDILDVLDAIDIALGVIAVPTECQWYKGNVPNGLPDPQGTGCRAPNEEIDIFDILVIIDVVLERPNCCEL